MTRINVVEPTTLCDQHLLAEHRELTRIPNCINSGFFKSTDIPTQYVLGKGHVNFFKNKLKWLSERYDLLHSECINRGFNVVHKFPDVVPQEYYNDYFVTPHDIKINQERIDIRMPKKARFRGKVLAIITN